MAENADEHGHGHEGAHERHAHDSDLREISRRRLWWATAIIFVFLVVEVAGG
jgi:Co/Zn/Cd efflux system component